MRKALRSVSGTLGIDTCTVVRIGSASFPSFSSVFPAPEWCRALLYERIDDHACGIAGCDAPLSPMRCSWIDIEHANVVLARRGNADPLLRQRDPARFCRVYAFTGSPNMRDAYTRRVQKTRTKTARSSCVRPCVCRYASMSTYLVDEAIYEAGERCTSCTRDNSLERNVYEV